MRLFFRKYGEGPPLVILHGLLGMSDNWITIAGKISNRFTVILPDLRNHGQSPHSSEHDYNSMSTDIYDLVSELGFSKFFLAGHSMGGKTAMYFAMKWPEMIEGLLIADISPFYPPPTRLKDYKQHESLLNTILETDISDTGSRNSIEIMLKEKIPSEKLRALIMKNIERTDSGSFAWRINAPVLIRNLDKILEDITPMDEKDKCITGFPVIFLKGENSEYLMNDDLAEITRLFPSAEIRTVSNAGHWIHADAPDMVARHLLSLLD